MLFVCLVPAYAVELVGCRPQAANTIAVETTTVSNLGRHPPWFEDVTAKRGLDFLHDSGPTDGTYFMPQINGSGAALLDFDNDGRLDIYLLQFSPDSSSTNALYRQLPSGDFENVSEGSGLNIPGYNTGVAVGDVNNDGWVDVLVTQYKGVKLLTNIAGRRFVDVTEQAGLGNPLWGTSASFFDYDRDGWLDLFVANYVMIDESIICRGKGGKRDYCAPNSYQSTCSYLCRNRGIDDEGNWLGFEDVTQAAGIGQRVGTGLGVLCADFNGDHWPDIFVANDARANHLWINQKNGVFEEEAVLRGVAFDAMGKAQGNMGVAYGDADGDGLSDLFVTHFFKEYHGFWKQISPGSFQDHTIAAGIPGFLWRGTGFGTVFADFDQDGWLDLALVNGFVLRREAPMNSFWDEYMDRNQLFVNDGQGCFRDVSSEDAALCGEPNVGRGLCLGDLDNDGGLDLLLTVVAGPARILRNVAPQRGHWLIIRAYDPVLNRDAIGAEITLDSGRRRWQRIIQPGQSFQCSNDVRAHFGLGKIDSIDSIEVLWPDGMRERFAANALDRVQVVEHGKGQRVKAIEEDAP